MNAVALGGLLGLLVGVGLLIVIRGTPRARRIGISERIAPYLGQDPRRSTLFAGPVVGSSAYLLIRRVLGPALGGLPDRVDRLLGGGSSVRRRLAAAGETTTLEQFRIEQAACAAGGFVVTAVTALVVSAARGGVDPVLVGGAALVGLVGGALLRDTALSQRVARRHRRMLAEFPVVADLLALAVVAGESPADALDRVCRLTGGELAREIGGALDQARSGASLTAALTELAERNPLEVFGRFVQGLVVAIERGTPLADVLRAQAVDVHEARKRALLEAGGRKEVSMMLPVVFLILPVTVLFALYPGLLSLMSMTR